jgi:hypothetical protein
MMRGGRILVEKAKQFLNQVNEFAGAFVDFLIIGLVCRVTRV